MSVKDVDGHKLSYHPNRVSKWLKNGKCFPLHIEIGITNRCNHKCSFCTLDWICHGGVDIKKDVMFRAIENFNEMGVKSIYFAGEGEPTLHKDFPMFVRFADSNGIKVAMSTNGSLFSEELAQKVIPYLSWMRFSVDAYKPETHSKLHGVSDKSLYKVFDNIQYAAKIKKENNYNVQIGTQAILMPENMTEMEDLGKKMKELGADNFQVKPAHNHPKSTYDPGAYQLIQDNIKEKLDLLSDDSFVVVVRLKSMERLFQERNYQRCHAFDFYGLIDARGNVVPCNVFYNNPEYIYGNINEESFFNIWIGNRKQMIMNKIEESNHGMCGNYRCRLDVMNRYLERVKTPEVNDEFI